ncbi:hypothetical protein BGZ94_004834 [Podila epigama]|nr:hypothetical protein BGZ94_004834 [Podila epigama]
MDVFFTDLLQKLLTESCTPHRPEVRAKASIALVAFALEQILSADLNADTQSSFCLDAWIGVICGLGDEWPLVREAFEEQLVKAWTAVNSNNISALRLHDVFFQQVQRSFVAAITEPFTLARLKELKQTPQSGLRTAAGMLKLKQIIRRESNMKDPSIDSVSRQGWSKEQVHDILKLFLSGRSFAESQESVRINRLLADVVPASLLIQSLGLMTSSHTMDFTARTTYITFCNQVLEELARSQEEKVQENEEPMETSATQHQTKDWALAFWISEQLRIPIVFSSREFMHDSETSLATATEFVQSISSLLRCIQYLVQIQPIDNAYTLHRMIISSTSFTNPLDLWVSFDLNLSPKIVQQAHDSLKAIIHHTPWSDRDNPTTSTGSGVDKSFSATTPRRQQIMIPGSLSDHVIKIIEKDIRPCFIHARAQKITDRARSTVVAHQDRMKQLAKAQQDVGDEGPAEFPTYQTPVSNVDQGRIVRRQESNTTRFHIAEVGDDSNDMEDLNQALEQVVMDPTSNTAALVRTWDTNCLEAVAVLEWCVMQPIRDRSRAHEVFMMLVGPILALLDSPRNRFRTRGLDMLCRFLIQQQQIDLTRLNKRGRDVHALPERTRYDARIWIRIFERTGLDQVLVRSMVPLLVPLHESVAPNAPVDPKEALFDDKEYSQDLMHAAFRAYLTLIMVNSEPESWPPIPRPIFQAKRRDGSVQNLLTVEELFIKGILGRLGRVNSTKRSRVLVLKWMQVLLQDVIPVDEVVVRPLENEYFTFDSVVRDGIAAEGSVASKVGIYGMGVLAMKYLPTLVGYMGEVLDIPLPSSPVQERKVSLELARQASETLYELIRVARERIPRYRGRILAAIANCWANSRVFEDGVVKSSHTKTTTDSLVEPQKQLDDSLVKTLELLIDACRQGPLKTTETADGGGKTDETSIHHLDNVKGAADSKDESKDGLLQDLEVLKNLDPPVFEGLFRSILV